MLSSAPSQGVCSPSRGWPSHRGASEPARIRRRGSRGGPPRCAEPERTVPVAEPAADAEPEPLLLRAARGDASAEGRAGRLVGHRRNQRAKQKF